jgi:gas vesicle protein
MIWYEYLIVTGIPTIAVVIVGFILRNQIKAQNEMIENYQEYIKTIDWKSVKEWYEKFEIPKIISEIEKDVNKQFNDFEEEINPHVDKLVKDLKDLYMLVTILGGLYVEEEERKKVADVITPNFSPYLVKSWALLEQHIPEHPKTHEG